MAEIAISKPVVRSRRARVKFIIQGEATMSKEITKRSSGP